MASAVKPKSKAKKASVKEGPMRLAPKLREFEANQKNKDSQELQPKVFKKKSK